jgi:hypothetical protein
MSEIKVNKISPKQLCTQLTLGDSGDTIIIPTGVNFNTDGIKNLNTSTIITQTNATTITLGYSGSTIAIASGATQTGFGRTGTVNWDTTAKTTTVTAVSGVGYFVDTTTTTLTVNLPVGAAGDIVAISDYANTAATNNITINPNGTDKINGVNANATISTNGASITLVYVDSTRGWKDIGDATLDLTGIPPFITATGGTETTCGDYKIHTFTGPGTFTVTNAGSPAGSTTVDYLVVAGGGGGGTGNPDSNEGGAGAGAGGYRESSGTASGSYTRSPLGSGVSALPVSVQPYPITIGGGGAAATPAGGNVPGGNGNPSIFSTITSTGGGGGGSRTSGYSNGNPGGSGGGTSTCYPGSTVGAGNTPPVSPPQGQPGGTSKAGGSALGPTPATFASADGAYNDINLSTGEPGPAGRYYASGGGSGGPPSAGTAGLGGGGDGGYDGVAAQNGTANTGGGAGGANRFLGPGPDVGGAGGSGIVIIRYKYQ